LDGGWFFTRSGDAYVALRVATGNFAINPGDASIGGVYLDLGDKWSPIVIQLGQATSLSFEAFKAAVKVACYAYNNGVLTYTSLNGDVYEIRRYSDELPNMFLSGSTSTSGGSLDPAKTYSSPYIQGVHGEDTVTLSYGSNAPLVLDFSL
jgi:hypothetical protein